MEIRFKESEISKLAELLKHEYCLRDDIEQIEGVIEVATIFGALCPDGAMVVINDGFIYTPSANDKGDVVVGVITGRNEDFVYEFK